MRKSTEDEVRIAATLRGVVFLLVRGAYVLMERCPKKATEHGGAWFFPGGRIELGESPAEAMCREMLEELGVRPTNLVVMPIVDMGGSGGCLMQPYLIRAWDGELPTRILDHPEVPLRWVPIKEAARSPVRGVRGMVAALTAPHDERPALLPDQG